MKLAYNSPFRKLYNLIFYNDYDHTPSNFCDLFWGNVFGIILLPIILPTIILRLVIKDTDGASGGIYVNIGVSLVFYLICLWVYGLIILEPGAWILFGTFSTLGIVIFIWHILNEKKVGHSLSQSLKSVGEGFRSIKEKYCPIIEWKKK